MTKEEFQNVMSAFGCSVSDKYKFYNLDIRFEQQFAIVLGNIPMHLIEIIKDKYHFNLLDVEIEDSYYLDNYEYLVILLLEFQNNIQSRNTGYSELKMVLEKVKKNQDF